MTKIKLCGLSRMRDIEAANALGPDYIGLVFAPKSRRYVAPEQAMRLKRALSLTITAVGVFVDAAPEEVARLLTSGVIDMAQLHGSEDEKYLAYLKSLTDRPVIKAFRADSQASIAMAKRCSADYIMLDAGAGTGTRFDWRLLSALNRPYFLAGGLTPENIGEAIRTLAPYAVDVSSGIETDGLKDERKMRDFVRAARKEDEAK